MPLFCSYNILFDKKKDYEKLNGELDGDSVIPDAEESNSLWNGIGGGGVGKEHNRTADWLEGLKGERDYDQQEALEIFEVMIKKQCNKFTIGKLLIRMAFWGFRLKDWI